VRNLLVNSLLVHDRILSGPDHENWNCKQLKSRIAAAEARCGPEQSIYDAGTAADLQIAESKMGFPGLFHTRGHSGQFTCDEEILFGFRLSLSF